MIGIKRKVTPWFQENKMKRGSGQKVQRCSGDTQAKRRLGEIAKKRGKDVFGTKATI